MLKTAVTVLGNNLQNLASQVRATLQVVGGHLTTRINKISPLYATIPVGYDDQSDFISVVYAVGTSLSAEELLVKLSRTEVAFSHERNFHNAPRTLDLDVIDLDGRSSNGSYLTLLHPRAYEHGFVMLPLAGILSTLRLGDRGTVVELATELGGSGAHPLDEGAGQDWMRGRLKIVCRVFRRPCSMF